MEAKERQYSPGERVPGTEYVVVRLEAEGGHGALYLVHHHFLEKKIQMLKTLRSFQPSADLVERLKREAQMLAAMDHPHIVSVASGGLTDEKEPRPYFVMERLKGRSLAQILAEAPEGVGVDAALKLAIEVCDALEYVHVRHGVVHRDIKPDNIFLHITPRNGSITKILDFGVAHIIDIEKRYTKNNLFLGTPRYAAPEQIMGERPSPQTDLYAVGLLLYELLLGHGPFDDAQTFAAVATAHLQRSPTPFPATRRFPEGLEPIVMSLLAKSPAERPRSADWLATQLRQIKRVAELAEQMQAADVSQTDLSPVQNILTAHRGELTEAGPPPDVASERTVSPPESAPPTKPPSTGPVTAPFGERDTVRLAAPEPAPAPVDRAAATRSLRADELRIANSEPRTGDTEQMPHAGALLPHGDPREPTQPPSQGGRGPPSPTGTSTNASVELTRGLEGRSWSGWPALGGSAAGLAVVALAVAIYASHAVPETSAAPAADAPSAALGSEPSAPTATPKTPPPTAVAAPAAPTPSGRSSASPGASSPIPESATPGRPSLPTPTATVAPARARAPVAKPAPLRLPTSGLD